MHISISAPQFCSEPKTALKNCLNLKNLFLSILVSGSQERVSEAVPEIRLTSGSLSADRHDSPGLSPLAG